MHTLSVHGGMSEISYRSPEANFPQVRTLLLPAFGAGYLVPCCPQVRAVISCARMKGWTDLVGLFDDAGDTLEVLDGFLMSPETIECEGFLLGNPSPSRLNKKLTYRPY
jgi:hypothetical protein